VDSVSGIWPAAAWMEREIYDMFGIHFVGHDDFRRLLLPTDWEGHPLQKDYQESEVYRGITTTRWEGHPLQKDYQESEVYRGITTTREEIEGILAEESG
jgi:NADH:ubiquinone oxidoreductase subunit C